MAAKYLPFGLDTKLSFGLILDTKLYHQASGRDDMLCMLYFLAANPSKHKSIKIDHHCISDRTWLVNISGLVKAIMVISVGNQLWLIKLINW